MAEKVTLGTILSIKWNGCDRDIMETGEDAADYATLFWPATNPRPKPSLVEIIALRPSVTNELAAQAIADRRRDRFENDGGTDNIFRAFTILVAQMDKLKASMKDTSWNGGTPPSNVAGWVAMKTRLSAIDNDTA